MTHHNHSTAVYLTSPQLAERLGVATITVKVWRQRRKGPPYVKIGRSVRYRVADVEAWADQQRVTPSEAV